MESSVTKGDATREAQLDFVRGMAIIAVMGFHFKAVPTNSALIEAIEIPLKNFGQEGVNLFFTLSGFLVGGLLFKSLLTQGRIYAFNFIIRRAFKIWPAYYFLIIFHVFSGRHPLDSFLVQNLVHMQNFLGTSIKQSWSLAVEEHFYLLLPPFLIFVWKRFEDPKKILLAIGAVSLLVLIGRSVAVYFGNLEAAFFQTQFRLDSLLLGVGLAGIYWFFPVRYKEISKSPSVLLLIVAATVAWILAFKKIPEIDRSVGYTVQALGFCALIMLVKEHSGELTKLKLYRLVAWVGVYSYGIYLWHSIALAPAAVAIKILTARDFNPQVIWVLVMVMQFAVAIIAGYLTTRAIEWPFLKLREKFFPAIRTPISKGAGVLLDAGAILEEGQVVRQKA